MSSSPKPPKPIDPTTVINAQTQANRVNRITPYGSQTYGPDGLTTTFSPDMQKVFDQAIASSTQKLNPLQSPQGFGDLQGSILNKVQSHYNQTPGQKGTQMQQMGNAAGIQPMQFGHPDSFGIQQINGQAVNPEFNSVLNTIWGAKG